ncbi:MAG TPA: GDCCVxC domain-containing (seleno)protein [Nitrosopumilaceae archaeon]|nr:GDCCVxC domain-containing (seleno)protein [Nitrosopumilaceae archaeon]
MFSRLLNIFIVLSVLVFIQCNTPVPIQPTSSVSSVLNDTSLQKTKILDTTALTSIKSAITCPKCGHKKMETMPTDVCLIKYTCEKCNTDLYPKKGDCCVFCTYGTVKCPSMQ